jgi:hypothetical protein
MPNISHPEKMFCTERNTLTQCNSTRLRAEESAFNRAAGAASAAEQSRWAAKSARWDGLLTFDTKNEIIILSSAEQRCPQS